MKKLYMNSENANKCKKDKINRELQNLYGNNVMKIVENKKIFQKALNHSMLNGFLLFNDNGIYKKAKIGRQRFSTN
jgi:hypothetical protein